MRHVRVLGPNVVVVELGHDTRASGLLVPPTVWKGAKRKGKVVAVGEWVGQGVRRPLEVREGDVVVYPKASAQPFPNFGDGPERFVVHEDALILKLEEG